MIEIRELVVRATVSPDGESMASGCGPAKGSDKKGQASPDAAAARSQGDVVQTCIREVLRILEEKRER